MEWWHELFSMGDPVRYRILHHCSSGAILLTFLGHGNVHPYKSIQATMQQAYDVKLKYMMIFELLETGLIDDPL